MRRYLPFLLIGLVALVVLPQLLGKKSSTSLSSKAKAAMAVDAVHLIDRAEAKFLAANGSYTGHIADLVATNKRLADDLTVGLTVDIDVGTDGKSYLARVTSDVITLARARTGKKLTAESCRVLKSKGGVKCPGENGPKNEDTPAK